MKNDTPADSNQPATAKPAKQRCLNCDKQMPRKATFCPHCGQRNNRGKVTMRELLQRLWANVSHLDAKFVKVFWQLFIPGKVTSEYFKGRQKRYPNPIQFFFVALFFLLLATNLMLIKAAQNMRLQHEESRLSIQGKLQMAATYSPKIAALRDNLQQAVGDTLPLDTLFQPLNLYENLPKSGETLHIRNIPGVPDLRIDKQDWYALPPDSMAIKYGYTSWMGKRAIEQIIKSRDEKNGIVKFYLSTLAASILLLTAIMATVLYFFYRRQRRYYVEHFVFLLHLYAMFMLLTTIWTIVVVTFMTISAAALIFPPAIVLLIHSFFAFRRFYPERFRATLMHWALYHILAFFIFSGLFTVGISFSLFFF